MIQSFNLSKVSLSDNDENKVKLLFLMKELFKKDNLSNVFTKFLSDRLKEIELSKVPENYKDAVIQNIIDEEEYELGKIKYDDKILHQSRVIKYYTENADKKKFKKILTKFMPIKKNRKYFILQKI